MKFIYLYGKADSGCRLEGDIEDVVVAKGDIFFSADLYTFWAHSPNWDKPTSCRFRRHSIYRDVFRILW